MNSLDPWRVIALDASGEVVWPRPQYGHPFYREIPSWIHYGDPRDTHRELFDGVFIGADSGADMSNTGITFKKELDERQVLHVEICVDGKCYRASMDLAPAISMILTKLAQSHADLHKATGAPLPNGEAVVVPAVERAVNVAGDAMIAMLANRHNVAVQGFFDDIGHALGSAANAVGGALKSLKGPASLAAGAAATYFGGPAAGPIASQLTGALIDAAPGGGHPAQQAAAQQTIAAAKQAAKTNPTIQTALDAAHHATTQTQNAALGTTPQVPSTPGSLTAVVQKLLPLATQAISGSGGGGGGGGLSPDLQSALATFASTLGGGGGGTVASGWPSYSVVGSFWDDVKDAVLTVTGTKATNQFIHDNHLEGIVGLAGQAVATYYGGPAAGAAAKALGPTIMSLGVDDKQKAQAAQVAPQMAQAVDAAHGAIAHTGTAYHVAQIVSDAKAGNPQAQQALANLRARAHSGDRKARRALHAARMINQAQQQTAVPGAPPPVGPPGAPPAGPPPGAPAGPPVGAWNLIAGVVVGCECGTMSGGW